MALETFWDFARELSHRSSRWLWRCRISLLHSSATGSVKKPKESQRRSSHWAPARRILQQIPLTTEPLVQVNTIPNKAQPWWCNLHLDTHTSHRDIQCALGVIPPRAGIKLCPQQKTPNKSNSTLIKLIFLHCATLNVCALCYLILYIIIWNVMLGDFSKNRCVLSCICTYIHHLSIWQMHRT